MKIIDIHSHILPGLDDGAKDEKESLEMLRIAAENGITDIIATPHFHYRRGHATPEQIKNAVNKMQGMLNDSGIPVQLHAGNELYYTHEILETVKAGAGLTMAGSDYVLLEFSPETEKRKIQHAVYQFLTEGYYPIIAHMERYAAFQTHPDFIDEILEMGAYYQLNAGSLMGQAGWKTRRFAKSMIKNGMIHFVATDAHDTEKRIPGFSKAETWLLKKYGESETSDYLYRNPKMILENKVL
ncbi:MAG: hypothetical protein IJ024_06145 [Lachnospiraceae bacterium]|nr:hypothetical protein [Lachnospiraceae bacterium]